MFVTTVIYTSKTVCFSALRCRRTEEVAAFPRACQLSPSLDERTDCCHASK